MQNTVEIRKYRRKNTATNLLDPVARVLIHDALRLLLVPAQRLVRPPVAQDAPPVALPALVVEPVGDLVADHRAHAAKVHVLGHGRVEEHAPACVGTGRNILEKEILFKTHLEIRLCSDLSIALPSVSQSSHKVFPFPKENNLR